MKLIALILMLIAPSWATAQKYDERVKFSDIGPLFIDISDAAKNGCWTNIMEVKNYAAGQIDLAGGKVVETRQEAKSYFFLSVIAERMHNGACYGFAQVELWRPDNYSDITTAIVFSETIRAAIRPSNYNTFVLDTIKEAVAEWKD